MDKYENFRVVYGLRVFLLALPATREYVLDQRPSIMVLFNFKVSRSDIKVTSQKVSSSVHERNMKVGRERRKQTIQLCVNYDTRNFLNIIGNKSIFMKFGFQWLFHSETPAFEIHLKLKDPAKDAFPLRSTSCEEIRNFWKWLLGHHPDYPKSWDTTSSNLKILGHYL